MSTVIADSSQGLALALCLGSLLTAGCKPGAVTQDPDSTTDQDASHQDALGLPADAERVVFASAGVPHGSTITLVSLSPDGSCAMSRDASGSVRLWPALDGSREPLVVPIQDPDGMSVAAADGGGWTLVLRDAAGGARIVSVDATGQMRPAGSLAPTDPLAELIVLPGGEQLLAVGRDHTLRLLELDGRELARLDMPGLRIAHLRVAMEAEGGPLVVALTAAEFDRKKGKFALEVIPLEIRGDVPDASLGLRDDRQAIFLSAPPTRDNPSLAPDGRAVVYIQQVSASASLWQVTATQLADGASVSVDSGIQTQTPPLISLLPDGQLLLDDTTGIGRVIDLRERKVVLRPLRAAPNVNTLFATSASGTRVLPAGSWLAVHELEKDDLVYLGYKQIAVNYAGLSPNNEFVAWALGDGIAIEQIGGEREVVSVPGPPVSQRFAEFLDDDLLLTLDWSGGGQLVRWRDGEVVGSSDLAGIAQTAELARDGHGDGLLLLRTNTWQNPTVVEIHDRQLGARHMLMDASFTGLVAPQSSSGGLDEWTVWTRGAEKFRQYSVTQLAGGVDMKHALESGDKLTGPAPHVFSVGPDGTQYAVTVDGAQSMLHARHPGQDEQESLRLPPGTPILLVPSRDGRRLALVQQRAPGQILSVLDSETLQILWAQPVPPIQTLSWSDDGESLALPGTLAGGAVLDASSGSPRTARCGLEFEVTHTPPPFTGFVEASSLCEL